MWEFASGIGDLGETSHIGGDGPETRFFPDANFNLAENYLRRSGDEVAITYRGENVVERSLTFDELKLSVARVQQALHLDCLLYTSPSPRDVEESRMPSSA